MSEISVCLIVQARNKNWLKWTRQYPIISCTKHIWNKHISMIFLTMLPEIIIHIRTIDHFPYEYIFFIIGYCLSLHNLGINSMKFFHIAFSYFESSYWNSINYLYTFLEIILSPVSSKLFYTGCYYFQINIIGFQVGHNSS